MRFHLLGLAALVFLGRSVSLCAATYYVDYEEGSDGNDGISSVSPWRHCPGDPAAEAEVAAASLKAGDTVRFKGGVTYQLTGATGIALNWDGADGAPITYDGNSAGTWGVGLARFTDDYGAKGLTALAASDPRQHLAFKSLAFEAIGGASSLPADAGVPVTPRFGGGIAFREGVSDVAIEGCRFHELGYAFNQKPMDAASIAGTGILVVGASRGLSISNCTFARMAEGCDLSGAVFLIGVAIKDCVFRDSVAWTIDLPPPNLLTSLLLAIHGCLEDNNDQFRTEAWSGYGRGPRGNVTVLNEGGGISFVATAVAWPAPAFQWRRNNVSIPGATGATLALSDVTSADAGIYTATATNASGSTESNAVEVVVASAPKANPFPSISDGLSDFVAAPVIVVQPLSEAVAALGTATFSAVAMGSPAPTYQWMKNGVAMAGWTNATLTLEGVSNNDTGLYTVIATNTAGSATSAGATLSIAAASPTFSAPVFLAQPMTQNVPAASTASLSAMATGNPAPSYQWLKNGMPMAGWTDATLVLNGVTANDSGAYTVIASNQAGVAVSLAALLTVSEVAPVISVAPLAERVMTTGLVTALTPAVATFAIDGSAPKTVLIRALGPALGPLGLLGILSDPRVRLYEGDVLISENDNWGGAAALVEAGARAGATPIADLLSKDAAMLVTLLPGNYSVVVSGIGGLGGMAMIEVYEMP